MKTEREFLTERSGRMTQFAGAQRSFLSDGKATGVEMVELWNYAGINLQLLLGRGMDIGRLTLCGVPFSYMAKPGIVAPAYYESTDMNWLRNFFAGMLTTCGLSNVGGPGKYEDPVIGTQHLGLHGRISNTAAENVSVHQGWEGDDYIVRVSGEMREACLHAENFVLRRQVRLSLKEKTVYIDDEIENESYLDRPLMILYHINVGYPVLSEKAQFVRSAGTTISAGEFPGERWDCMELPQKGYQERVYLHKPAQNQDAFAAVVNLDSNLGIVVAFDPKELPCLTQWKMCNLSEYVMGIEPANCYPKGREWNQENGSFEILPAGGKKHISLKLHLINEREELLSVLKKGERP